jgi:hypothetical protein
MTRPDALSQVLARAAAPEAFAAWERAAATARFCRHPVRLVGSSATADAATGELLGRFSSTELPDGVLLKACGQRRSSVCPPCSEVYRGDAWHLLVAGLRGGKGVPEEVSAHPAVLATFTAPSFGAVHSRREGRGRARRCRPRSAGACDHGRPAECRLVHEPADGVLGDPVCADCFDYVGAVLWNSAVTELWRRTTLGLESVLSSMAGMSRRALRSQARLSYAKVVEYQRRGVVHLHVVIRLDAIDGPGQVARIEIAPDALVGAVHRAAAQAVARLPETPDGPAAARWGEQLDVRLIGTEESVPRGAVAAYVAKYATKSTEDSGALDHRLRGPADLAGTHLRPHLARMVLTAWELGGRSELEALRLRAWAHTLGFRGHWLTKSRRYSTTFRHLRQARSSWRSSEGAGEGHSVAMGDWRYAGRGWTHAGDAWLAESAADRAAEHRRLAREERRTGHQGWINEESL